eukprot:INCI17506.7.p1 GENE.INCI17506.7~~INCI17506.7.p1  ORF type:complete len:492 (+),score=104.22 INCI17506.7:173-1648(+)
MPSLAPSGDLNSSAAAAELKAKLRAQKKLAKRAAKRVARLEAQLKEKQRALEAALSASNPIACQSATTGNGQSFSPTNEAVDTTGATAGGKRSSDKEKEAKKMKKQKKQKKHKSSKETASDSRVSPRQAADEYELVEAAVAPGATAATANSPDVAAKRATAKPSSTVVAAVGAKAPNPRQRPALKPGAGAGAAGAASATRPRQTSVRRADAWVAQTRKHPFETVSSDHAETPRDAYVDICPFLHACATAAASARSGERAADASRLIEDAHAHKRLVARQLRIWDPYYCAGTVVRLLDGLGFPGVINRNVDCYRTPAPDHDVLMTNPPFSGDHLQRIVEICASRSAPFCLLVPNFVIGHGPWRAACERLHPPPFYVVPHRRYTFSPPDFAIDKAKVAQKGGATLTSPFETIWLCWAPAPTYKLCQKNAAGLPVFNPKRVAVFWTLKAVPSEHRDVTDPAKKRPNPKVRKRLAAKRKKRAANYGGGSRKNIRW